MTNTIGKTLVTVQETHQGHRGMEILQFNLEPAFNAWKKVDISVE